MTKHLINLVAEICKLGCPVCSILCYTKTPWCNKSEAKSEAPVIFIFCIGLKGVISGRGQGLLFCVCSHLQSCANKQKMHVDKQLKPEQLKEPTAMYDCGQHLCNSQL